MPDYGVNLRRLMARFGLTVDEVVRRSELDERTVKGLLNGSVARPHARTLHKLAAGLGVPADELFQNPSVLAHRLFDRETNPVIDELTGTQPQLFEGWSEADFDELYSHFGSGGQLTPQGALEIVGHMNRDREVHNKVALVLQSNDRELLSQLVDTLYRRVLLAGNGQTAGDAPNG